MTIGTRGIPSAGAKRFVIDGKVRQYDAYIDVIDGISKGWFELDCRYRDMGGPDKWVWLSGPVIDESHTTTGAGTDAELDKAIGEINDTIKKVFGGESSPIPDSGIKRIEWLVTNGLVEKDNAITKKR